MIGNGGKSVLYDLYYGGMYTYENTNTLVVPVANEYIAAQGSGLIAGLLHNFTFLAGTTGAIAKVDNYTTTVPGTILITSSTPHGLSTGDYITIYNTTNYNGIYKITKISATEYYITKSYVATNTGNFARGARLVAGASSTGIYHCSLSLTAISVTANKIIKFEVCINDTTPDNIVVSRAFDSTDYTPMSSNGVLSIVSGDHLWFQLKNETSGTNVTIRHANFNLHRLG